MEKRIYKTKVDMEKANNYILGRITGIMQMVCEEDPLDPHMFSMMEAKRTYDDGSSKVVTVFLTTETTEERYNQFKKIVESGYGHIGIVEFDVGNKG